MKIEPRRRRRRPAWGKIALAVLVIVGLAAAWRFTPISEWLTHERVAGWAKAVRGTWWAPYAVILSYTPAAFILFPRPLLTLFTVVAFGPWLGFTYSMIGIMLSAVATFYPGRFLSMERVKKLAGDDFDKVSRALRKHGFLATFAVRIVAIAPFAVEGIIAGAARIKLRDYLAGTFAGMAPGVLATTVFGFQIMSALEDPEKINWWIVAAVVLAMIALSWWVTRWFASQNGDESPQQAQPART